MLVIFFFFLCLFFLMIRRPPRSTLDRSSAASDVYKRQVSSNSLTEKERDIFVSEVSRILKGGGYFLTKALCKDADKNAKNLLKKFAGTEKDCYTLPAVGITERVWSREDFIDFYGKYFEIICLEKKVGFPRVNGQSFKRNFWICYMQNK